MAYCSILAIFFPVVHYAFYHLVCNNLLNYTQSKSAYQIVCCFNTCYSFILLWELYAIKSVTWILCIFPTMKYFSTLMLVYTTKGELPFHSALYNNHAFGSKHSQLFVISEVTARDWYIDVEAPLHFYIIYI